jgi:hypothetical protein
MHVLPVFTCIKPCRRPPVVGDAKLWKSRTQVLTRHAASQQERALIPSATASGQTPLRAETGSQQLKWKLATLGALASPALPIILAGYIQSKPNTAGVALTSPFDGERAFTDLRRLVAFGPRPSGSPALERTREFIVRELRAAGAGVTEDRFIAKTPIGAIPMTDIVAKIPGASQLSFAKTLSDRK